MNNGWICEEVSAWSQGLLFSGFCSCASLVRRLTHKLHVCEQMMPGADRGILKRGGSSKKIAKKKVNSFFLAQPV